MGLIGYACIADIVRSVSVCNDRNSTKPLSAADTDADFALLSRFAVSAPVDSRDGVLASV